MRFLPVVSALALAAGIVVNAGMVSPVHEGVDRCGCTVRRAVDGQRTLYLVFTADSMFEGGNYALDVLRDKGVKASFFFTGNFLRDTAANAAIVRRTVAEGHYVGPHSDRHILLADWDDARTTLATADSAVADMEANYAELARYGVRREDAPWIIPPYEWYNAEHIQAFRANGMLPVSPSPGIMTFRDYTTPDMPDYWSADSMWRQLMERERKSGLDGSFIILHLGTQDVRTDKFYRYLPAIIDTLREKGYVFSPL